MTAATAAADLVAAFQRGGVTTWAGVPCSLLGGLFDVLEAADRDTYVRATSEGEALSIAAAAWLAGGLGVVLCQNSGLGNLVNPAVSLCNPSRLPAVLVIGYRGAPGQADEPQHRQMGAITTSLLDLLGIDWRILPDDAAGARATVAWACHSARADRALRALLVGRGRLESHRPAAPPCAAALPSRYEAITHLRQFVDERTWVVATTGMTGRELFAQHDSERHFYCVGAMGFASALAHGLALRRPGDRIVVLDGDGAALMHLGNMATVGWTGPPDLVHVVLDNGGYDSTGAQPSVAGEVDFAGIAAAVGYRTVRAGLRLTDIDARTLAAPGPALLHVPIRFGSIKGAPRPDVPPDAVAGRFRQSLGRRAERAS